MTSEKKALIEDTAIKATAEFLKSMGWEVAYGGFSSIEQGTLKYNFRLIFAFTGTKDDASKIKPREIYGKRVKQKTRI